MPSSLVGALDRRGMDIDIVRQPPRVMLQLAQHPAPEQFVPTPGNQPEPGNERGDESSAPAAESAPLGISVVIVEPPQQHHIPELRHALATYYPRVRCYRYDAHGPTGQPRLEAFDLPSDPVSSELAGSSETPGGAQNPAAASDNASPQIKGAGQRLRSVIVKAPADRPAAHDEPLVSEEELTMLLGSDLPFETPHPPTDAGPEGE